MHRAPLDVDALRAALIPPWARVDVVAATASTNADLVQVATSAPDGRPADRCVLAAEHQVAGRGRLERTWTSPARAGLTVSVLFRPLVPAARWTWLPLLAGVALAEAVRDVTGVDATLKWPNDLLAPDGRKLAGVLAQTAADAVVLGIGLNVSTTAGELPVPTATSLSLAGAADVDRTELLIALLQRLDVRYARWVDADADADACGLAQDYRALCSTVGSHVRVGGSRGETVGTAVGVDPLGRLIVRDGAGDLPLSAGDVLHVRPSEG